MQDPYNLKKIDSLCILLGVDKKILLDIAHHIGKFVRKIPVKDKKGKSRTFIAPNQVLLKLHKTINKRILSKVAAPQSIISNNGSTKKNANLHAKNKVLGKLDIKSFFPSITRKKVKSLFAFIGCAPEVADVLSIITTYRNKVPLGFPTSSCVASLILKNMEYRLRKLCSDKRITFSIWVDDICFSGNQRVFRLKNLFCKIIESEGFKINPLKISFCDKMKQQIVTGLVINSGKPNIPKPYRKDLREELFRCVKYGPSSQARGNVQRLKNSLLGKIEYVAQIAPEKRAKFINIFNQIDWNR